MEILIVLLASGLIFVVIAAVGVACFIAGVVWLIASNALASSRRKAGDETANGRKAGPIVVAGVGAVVVVAVSALVIFPMVSADRADMAKMVYADASNSIVNSDPSLLRAGLSGRGSVLPASGENSWGSLVVRSMEAGEPGCLGAILDAVESSGDDVGYEVNDVINIYDSDGSVLSNGSALYRAVGDLYVDDDIRYQIVSVLLSHGADPNAVGVSGSAGAADNAPTPMMRAACGVGNRIDYTQQDNDYVGAMIAETDAVLHMLICNGGDMFSHPSGDYGRADSAYDNYEALLGWAQQRDVVSADEVQEYLDGITGDDATD